MDSLPPTRAFPTCRRSEQVRDSAPARAGYTNAHGGLSRRELLRDAAIAGAAATVASSPALGAVRRVGGGRRVAVLGGGMAGLAAAHELAERGFEVTVYERRA